MTDSEFIELVREMRKEQILYFRTRNYQHLEKSKKLEKKVDDFLNGDKKDSINQTSLFS